MGRYLDRLHAEYDELTQGITTVVDRAADENRDVTDSEQSEIERSQARRTALEDSIKHYTDLEATTARVGVLRSQVAPQQPRMANGAQGAAAPAYDMAQEFPSIGHYVQTVHRAMVNKDPEAIQAIERATAHQKTTDNPGLIPRPILGPVLNLFNATRPFINSITQRPLPAGKFDRPKVSQHVAVGVQAAEKDLTASQVMKVDPLAVTAATYAGHLNISRQDIKWSNPNILTLVYEDFAAVYAQQTDAAACADFLASITSAAVPIADASAGAFYGAIYGAAAGSLDATNSLPDTLWASPDVWATMGGATTTQGAALFPTLSPGSTAGSPMGLRFVVDANFPADTLLLGPSRYAEWYEDVDGIMQVGEPDVLGQMVGYAGFAAFLNVAPEAFTKFTPPVVGP